MTNYNAKCLVPLEAPTDALQYAINRTAREVVDKIIGEIRNKGCCIIRMEERQYDEQIMNSIAVHCRIDIDELVQCKDCRWYDKVENEVDTWSICTRAFGTHDSVIDTDYCSFAERREDGEA